MILIKTQIKILDNSGARIANTINILGKSYKSFAKIGDILIVSVKKIISNKKVEKGTIYKALVVRLKKKIFRYGGYFIKFQSNGVILLNVKKNLIGTRILSIVSQDLKFIGCLKVLSLAPSAF